jgi:AraC-like DNA-binding protein
MKTKDIIPVYKTIEELHAANGVHIPVNIPGFIAFPFWETYPSAKPFMPPYKKLFYQLVLMEDGSKAEFSLNTQQVKDPVNILYFNGPGHVYSYRRGDRQKGFLVYFTDEFISPLYKQVGTRFPFFKITELNLLSLTGEETQSLRLLLEIIVAEQRAFAPGQFAPGRVELVRHLLAALLLKIKAIYQTKTSRKAEFSRSEYLTDRFEQLVDNYYLDHKSVEEYAAVLAITPGYLSEVVQLHLGTTPKSIINQRLAFEAKNMLCYSQLTISEIAYQLGFADPTSFGKFFKKETRHTPSQFRQQRV